MSLEFLTQPVLSGLYQDWLKGVLQYGADVDLAGDFSVYGKNQVIFFTLEGTIVLFIESE